MKLKREKPKCLVCQRNPEKAKLNAVNAEAVIPRRDPDGTESTWTRNICFCAPCLFQLNQLIVQLAETGKLQQLLAGTQAVLRPVKRILTPEQARGVVPFPPGLKKN